MTIFEQEDLTRQCSYTFKVC